MLAYLLLFGTAFSIALVATPFVRTLAERMRAVDTPDATRKLHGRPIPKLGGIGVFVAFYAAVWVGHLIAPSGGIGGTSLNDGFALALACLGPALLVLGLGIADDLWPVKPWVKIGVQLVAGTWVYFFVGIKVASIANPVGDPVVFGLLSLPATLAWIVLVTNAFNIVDGMDGLAAGVAFIATSCMFLVSLQMGNFAIAAMAAALAGSVLGFLKYNFNPASIFLGDSGSLVLGFLLAVFSVAGSQKSPTAIAIAAPLFMLALPLVETATSMARRFLRGQSILEADSGHIHHQLLKRGFSPRRAAILLYIGSAIFGAASLFIVDTNARVIGATSLVMGVAAWLGIQQLGYSEFLEINKAFKRGFFYQRRIIQNSILMRRLADDLLAAGSLPVAWDLLVEMASRLEFSRLELRLPSLGGPAEPNSTPVLVWCSPDSARGDHHRFTIHLTSGDVGVGDLHLSRLADAEPLHSELALLVDTLSRCLPPLLKQFHPEVMRAEASALVSKAPRDFAF